VPSMPDARRPPTDNSALARPELLFSAQNRPPTDNEALAGRICRFEAVRAWGDAEVLRLAKLQHGCVHRSQFHAAGFSNKALARRVAHGRLDRLQPDVFLVKRQSPALLERAMAAALEFRGDAVVGGLAAARIWRMVDEAPSEIDVTVAGRNAAPRHGVQVRRVKTLARNDVRWRTGIPLTSPARTLIELGAVLDPLELENALAETLVHRLARAPEIAAAIQRAHRFTGIPMLRQLLSYSQDSGAAPARTRSVYERKLLKLIAAAQLPRPVTNVPVEGHVVDMFWPAQRLVVEFDGFAYHSGRRAFEHDRLRDQDLVAAGYRVIRITARQLDQTPFAVIARLAQALRPHATSGHANRFADPS
jgi:very-short-patch-repair endonuclease